MPGGVPLEPHEASILKIYRIYYMTIYMSNYMTNYMTISKAELDCNYVYVF